MGSFTVRTHLSPSPPFFFTNPVKNFMDAAGPSHIHLNPQRPIFKNPPISRFPSDPTSKNPAFPLSCVTIHRCAKVQPPSSVSERLQRLGLEFRSLPAPIDRVKRLLHYAAILPPFDEARRVQENRVLGCTTQVWLEAAMDGNGAMRFRIDSDSEITKGFCSCLIWVLDGAAAEEVLSVRSDDLAAMNVGLPSRGNSRVNAWNNVLVSMQRRTEVLVEERRRGGFGHVSSFICCNQTQMPRGVAVRELS
ncbi:sufE-like protein 2, chloroplastic [Salvia miltiorrhiza]|uniref:sufE-like protein 2, chloroplastic n=1 Tax=Salvia miltiorrhiza TaxID=226208 RepID=UPI0025AB814B|nr:sufE-like protein 2, chloroplastic [Salvia miltiorrhiza]